MYIVTAIFIFIMAHYIFDWIFQRAKTAYGKLTDKFIRIIHCLSYTFGMVLTFTLIWNKLVGFSQLRLFSILVISTYIFITHLLIDTPNFKLWIVKHTRQEYPAPEWYLIKLDEILHLISLAPLIVILELGHYTFFVDFIRFILQRPTI